MSLLPGGRGLLFNQWGRTTDRPAPPPSLPDRVSFSTPLDVAPLEYATSGTRHVEQVEMVIERDDGRRGASWTLDDDGGHGTRGDAVSFTESDGVSTLAVRFRDDSGDLALTLGIRTDTRHDVVEKWAHIANHSADRTVTLPRVFSGAWPIPVGSAARIDYLAGAWGREFQPHHVDLTAGTFSLGSRQGVTGHTFAPTVCVSALLPGEGPSSPWDSASSATVALATAAPATGSPDAFGVALAWCGSWRLAVQAPSYGDHVRVSCGVDDEDTTVTLLPGESFTTPSTLGTWSPDGPAGVTRNWHAYQRLLSRNRGPVHRPVVYNSWYATEFDVRPEHQLKLADVAAEIGAEVFVVDDGWFTGRTSDRAGLGDWMPDPETFPDGLDPLVDGVRHRGMRFGLWVEPEAVNPDSDLYRAHPDWVYRVDGRQLTTVRNQLVLDFGRDDVVTWAEDTLRRLLSRYPVTYLKWDMNRPVSDGGRPGDPHGAQWSVQHAAGYLRVMRMLRTEFPHVTVEACASGGGRIDHAVLAVSDVVWTSDETGPRDRLRIQDGFLRAYAPHVMSSWVTDEAGLSDRAPASLGYRFVVAMAGVLGVGSDLLRWSADERVEARRLVDLYRELRPTLHAGEVAVHGAVHRPGYAVEYGDGDRTVLLVYDADRDRREPVRVRPRLLDPGASYQVRVLDRAGSGGAETPGTALGEPTRAGGGRTENASPASALTDLGPPVTGASARAAGIEVPWVVARDADVIVLDRLGASS
ncbi:alpha-galactosidase [Phytoactinopolyspora halotolerans]|uniref:alpha-galactosidase n=1 Tax=Phytoactinopolyspora halotolerans TaxID=1981512 RepID=UPI0013D87844|nr:alpha-galactosidase [Phytoactinopolyspora halotolerans]